MAPRHALAPLFLSLLLLLQSYTPSPVLSAAVCNANDKKALLRIKKALGNPYFIITWTAGTDCCKDWYAMECDPDTGRVTSIDMSGTDASGPIPAAVGDLPYLQKLILRKSPNVTGAIPEQIVKLANIKMLWIDWNSLTGPVPDFLGRIRSIEYINIGFNKLSGSIPASLGDLPRLGALFLDRNRLTGHIPEALGRLPQPDLYIRLSHNNLTGPIPASLGRIDIAQIDLSRNRLEGDPSALFGAPKKTFEIDLSRNLFQFDLTAAEFPSNIGVLDLNHNKIYGKIPKQITKLDNLQQFNVSYNRLCGEIPQGGRIGRFDESAFFHNQCLCGPPLAPCKK